MYELISKYEPSGDQPKAIKKLVDGIKKGTKHQVLLGATGTGKTFSTKIINQLSCININTAKRNIRMITGQFKHLQKTI